MTATAFMDPEHAPTEAEIADALGPTAGFWRALVSYLAETYGIEPVFVPPSRNYGWELKYRKGSRTLVSLTPDKGAFTALVVLGATETEAARTLDLGEHVRSVFEGAEQLRDGRWLFVRVESERDVKDIEALVGLKRRPRVRHAASAR